MPPRRSHKKSRAGCRRCKHRKIKCDEVHPRCGNCIRHGVLCDFEDPEIADELSTPAPSVVFGSGGESPGRSRSPGGRSSISTTAAPDWFATAPLGPSPGFRQDSLAASSQVDRLLELRLMHQYLTVTSKTLLAGAGDTKKDDIWQTAASNIEGRPYLADAMLCVAALHLRSLSPEDKTLVHATHAYAASSLADYVSALNRGITGENAESLFLTASLIAFQATASRIFLKEDADPESGEGGGRYSLPLPWFHAFQGVKTVVASSWQWIRSSPAVQAVIASQPGFNLDMNPRGKNSFFGHLLDGIDEELASEDPRMSRTTGQAYSHAVCVLNWAHKSVNPAATLAFPATVARRFVDLVEARRPRALAILAAFFALLKRLDHVWWLQDVARREVMGLVGLFEQGSKWWQHLEWPVHIALWDGNGSVPADLWGCEFQEESEATAQDFAESMMGHIELVAEMMGQKQGSAPPPTNTSTTAPPDLGDYGLRHESPD